jgi:predicted transcriptional regulator
MSNQWIVEVLADLRSFARANGLNALADHLDTTLALARAEIAALPPTAIPAAPDRRAEPF